jgi:hypothetical protein
MIGVHHMHGYTRVGMGALGDAVDPDTVSTLVSAGYDPGTISSLAQLGASDQQLQNLPYGPGTTYQDMNDGVTTLMWQLPVPGTGGMTVASTSEVIIGSAAIIVLLLLLRK